MLGCRVGPPMQNHGYATVGSELNTLDITYSVWFGRQRSRIYRSGNMLLSSPTNIHLVRIGLTQNGTHNILEASEIVFANPMV